MTLNLRSKYFASACFLGFFTSLTSQNTSPNIIFILTDDQGSGDLGCNGNKELKTPNIDSLAYNSFRFNNFHTGSTSSPTRSGLFTGKNGNSTGVWHTIMGRSYLDSEEVTLSETFSNSGYSTAIFGKWHLGDAYPYRPKDRGFHESLVIKGGAVGGQPDFWGNTYFDDTYFRNGNPEKQIGFCTDVWFQEAIKFIDKNKQKPFFCYLPLNAPHFPVHVDERYAARYRNNPKIPNPKFYGMIANIDENVGKLQAYLKNNGLDKNTIVIYMTDNGTSGGSTFDKNGFLLNGFNCGMRGNKTSPYEGGHRVPFFLSVPGKKGKNIESLTSYIDFMPTLVDMCKLKMPRQADFEGVSLKPLLEGKKIAKRTLVVDTQRDEFLEKNKVWCVMFEKWRLINGSELYDINSDQEQRINIASKHPKIVAQLKDEYEKWWTKTSVRAQQYQYINIGNQPATTLYSHDLHNDQNQIPAWDQEMVRQGKYSNGYWTIEVTKKGLYQFQLLRWPSESGLGILSTTSDDRITPYGRKYSKGKKLKIKAAKIKVAALEYSATISENFAGKSIDFLIPFEMGKYKISAEFIDDKNIQFSPYYVEVKMLQNNF